MNFPKCKIGVIYWAVVVSLLLHAYVLSMWWHESSPKQGSSPVTLNMRLLPSSPGTYKEPNGPNDLQRQTTVNEVPAHDALKNTDLSTLDDSKSGATKEYFYSTSELTEPPWLPGEPAFNFSALGEIANAINGELELELLIDEFGAVVSTHVILVYGLDSAVKEILTNQFSSYKYRPGRIGEAVVKSRSRVRIAFENGRKLSVMEGPT